MSEAYNCLKGVGKAVMGGMSTQSIAHWVEK